MLQHLTYTLLLAYITSINFLSYSLKYGVTRQFECGFLIPRVTVGRNLPFYCSNDQSFAESDSDGPIDNLNIYSTKEEGIELQPKIEDSILVADHLKKLGLDDIQHVELSEEDNLELQKILDKHIEIHKDEFECSQTEGETEVLKKPLPKKFDLDESDDEFDVENYNGKFPEQEEIEGYLEPLNLRNIAPKEEFTKRMIGRTYNLLNIPDDNNKTQCIDGARRFLYSLPLNNWNDNEKFILDEFIKRKRIKDQADAEYPADGLISPEELMNSSPSSFVGLVQSITREGSSYESNTRENNYRENNSLENMDMSIPQQIVEYTHYDLTKDLRDFRQQCMSKSMNLSLLDSPLFIRSSDAVSSDAVSSDAVSSDSMSCEQVSSGCESVELSDYYLKLQSNPDTVSVYSVWPVSTLTSAIPDGDYTEFEGNYTFDAQDESFRSFRTDSIPFDGKYRSGIIILEEELGGALDHRIRDYIDELSCISRFPAFIPRITSDYQQAFKILDRLIKNIQILYRIERISLVSFGRASRLALDYCYDRLGAEEYLNSSRGVLTLYEITSRTIYPVNVRIYDSAEFYERLQEEREIERAKRLNPVRPIKDLLQCLVFLDSRNINLDKALALGTPLLNVTSGNPIANSNGQNMGIDVLKHWNDLQDLGFKVNCENNKDNVSVFNILRPKGKIIYNLKESTSENTTNNNSQDNTNNTNRDNQDECSNMGTAFKIASFEGKKGPIYLLEDKAQEAEIREYNQALLYAYQWILHYAE